MNAKRRILPGLIFLVLMAAGPSLFGQTGRTGRQVPPLPRAWNEGQTVGKTVDIIAKYINKDLLKA